MKINPNPTIPQQLELLEHQRAEPNDNYRRKLRAGMMLYIMRVTHCSPLTAEAIMNECFEVALKMLNRENTDLT